MPSSSPENAANTIFFLGTKPASAAFDSALASSITAAVPEALSFAPGKNFDESALTTSS